MAPSMKQGLYHVYILLVHEGQVANIRTATQNVMQGRKNHWATLDSITLYAGNLPHVPMYLPSFML